MTNETSSPSHSSPEKDLDDTDTDETLLIVFLADFSIAEKEKLVDHFHREDSDFSVKTFHPHERFLRARALQGKHIDSIANIYALAIELDDMGWSSFLVADNLTRRQLQGRPICGESKDISAVMVSVRENVDDNKQVYVYARRWTRPSEEYSYPPDSEENRSLLDLVYSFEVKDSFIFGYSSGPDVFLRYGTELLDPDRTLFTPNAERSFGYQEIARGMEQALTTCTPLPLELVQDVVSRTSANLYPRPVVIPPDVSFDENEPCINIFLTFRTTVAERKALQALLQDAVDAEYKKQEAERKRKLRRITGLIERWVAKSDAPKGKPSVILISWDYDHPPSRRDILHMRTTTAAHSPELGPQFVNLLLAPLQDTNMDTAQFMTLFPSYSALLVVRTTLSKLVHEVPERQKHAKMDKLRQEIVDNGPLPRNSIEIFPTTQMTYEDPFYPNPPPWEPVDDMMLSIPLFFMTHFTTEEERGLIEMIQGPDTFDARRVGEDWGAEQSERKVVCTVPWKIDSEEDATMDYIWEALRMVVTSYRRPLFFADRQSLRSHDVIFVQKLYGNYEPTRNLHDPMCRGYRYARVMARDAHVISCNVISEDEDVENWTLMATDAGVMERPDLRRHGQ